MEQRNAPESNHKKSKRGPRVDIVIDRNTNQEKKPVSITVARRRSGLVQRPDSASRRSRGTIRKRLIGDFAAILCSLLVWRQKSTRGLFSLPYTFQIPMHITARVSQQFISCCVNLFENWIVLHLGATKKFRRGINQQVWETKVFKSLVNPWKHMGVGNMATVLSQKELYTSDSCGRNMQSVQTGFCRY